MVNQGTEPEKTPATIAAQPGMKPGRNGVGLEVTNIPVLLGLEGHSRG